MLHDALALERTAFAERLSDLDTTSVEEVLVSLVKSQQHQMDHMMRAIGNLESRIMAIQAAAGIDEVKYSAVDIEFPISEEYDEL